MKKRVLVVDDNVHLCEVMRKLLQSYGYDVLQARNGAEAVGLATLETPDAIILDMMLPIMDGFQVLAQLRENPKTRLIPVLAATAMRAPGDEQKCFASGCNGYISKPFTSAELKAAVEEVLVGAFLD